MVPTSSIVFTLFYFVFIAVAYTVPFVPHKIDGGTELLTSIDVYRSQLPILVYVGGLALVFVWIKTIGVAGGWLTEFGADRDEDQ